MWPIGWDSESNAHAVLCITTLQEVGRTGHPVQDATHPEEGLCEACLAGWIETDDCSLTTTVVHAANALEPLCTCCVPYSKRDDAPILHCNLTRHNTH